MTEDGPRIIDVEHPEPRILEDEPEAMPLTDADAQAEADQDAPAEPEPEATSDE